MVCFKERFSLCDGYAALAIPRADDIALHHSFQISRRPRGSGHNNIPGLSHLHPNTMVCLGLPVIIIEHNNAVCTNPFFFNSSKQVR
jgi:hypothetical protein